MVFYISISGLIFFCIVSCTLGTWICFPIFVGATFCVGVILGSGVLCSNVFSFVLLGNASTPCSCCANVSKSFLTELPTYNIGYIVEGVAVRMVMMSIVAYFK